MMPSTVHTDLWTTTIKITRRGMIQRRPRRSGMRGFTRWRMILRPRPKTNLQWSGKGMWRQQTNNTSHILQSSPKSTRGPRNNKGIDHHIDDLCRCMLLLLYWYIWRISVSALKRNTKPWPTMLQAMNALASNAQGRVHLYWKRNLSNRYAGRLLHPKKKKETDSPK